MLVEVDLDVTWALHYVLSKARFEHDKAELSTFQREIALLFYALRRGSDLTASDSALVVAICDRETSWRGQGLRGERIHVPADDVILVGALLEIASLNTSDNVVREIYDALHGIPDSWGRQCFILNRSHFARVYLEEVYWMLPYQFKKRYESAVIRWTGQRGVRLSYRLFRFFRHIRSFLR